MKLRFTMRDAMWLLIVVGLTVFLMLEHAWRLYVQKQNIQLTKDLDTWMRVESMDTQKINKLEDDIRATKNNPNSL
jgi:hypothetical protein